MDTEANEEKVTVWIMKISLMFNSGAVQEMSNQTSKNNWTVSESDLWME